MTNNAVRSTQHAIRNTPSIGVYDSGLGGLSVLRAVRHLLPQHDLRYLADTAYCPYGPRPVEEVRARACACTNWLITRGAAIVVVACNTASSAALELLRAEFPVPIVGMEPGIKPAIQATRTGRIGVLATDGTLAGSRFATLVERFATGVEVQTVPCPGLVAQVEAGDLNGPVTRALLTRYLTPLRTRGVDTLVLGCTHFPFLAPVIAELAGPEVTIIDTGPPVARQVARVAAAEGVTAGSGLLTCATTGEPAQVAPVMRQLLGADAPLEHAEC